jgi:AraC-like DNA-binding protein
VTDIAAHVHMSPSRLSHLFKAETGMSIMRYLSRARLDEAKRLLASPDTSVARVSEQVGFADPAHFSRSFKRAEGISPSDYRQRAITAG